MATKISHKIQEYRNSPLPYLELFLKKTDFFSASLSNSWLFSMCAFLCIFNDQFLCVFNVCADLCLHIHRQQHTAQTAFSQAEALVCLSFSVFSEADQKYVWAHWSASKQTYFVSVDLSLRPEICLSPVEFFGKPARDRLHVHLFKEYSIQRRISNYQKLTVPAKYT